MGCLTRSGSAAGFSKRARFTDTYCMLTSYSKKYENIGQILYCPITFAAKIAVLLQIMRVFKGNRRDSIYWSIQILIWTNFVFYTGIFFCSIFACMPREKIQDPMIHGRCIDSKKSIIATSAINIVSDFTILLLPAFAVWKIQIALKRKMVIAGVFGTGLLYDTQSKASLYS